MGEKVTAVEMMQFSHGTAGMEAEKYCSLPWARGPGCSFSFLCPPGKNFKFFNKFYKFFKYCSY